MFKIMLTMMLITLLSLGVMAACAILSKKTITNKEKLSPFECGFDPITSARIPFSLQFFLIAILFLIFDIEIVIILPMICTMKMSNSIYWSTTSMFMILLLLIGLYYEWKNGMLEWSK
uniref:NADH-ubiquinone oxidoreductase chain 3 n=1 Tax=Pachyphlegyas modiglianii TaxID=2816051 RepID=A0A8T9ZWM6_9HEMI|nr:NADH dehydrogenase subunit 3 [Pachyphlegyas modiglianii]